MLKSVLGFVSRSLIYAAVLLGVSNWLLLPIFNYFFPGRLSDVSPRSSLDSIISYKNRVMNLEKQLTEFATPGRREAVKEMFQQIDANMNSYKSLLDKINQISVSENSDVSHEYQALEGDRQRIVNDFWFYRDSFQEIFAILQEYSSITKVEELQRLQFNFDHIKKFGVSLDRSVLEDNVEQDVRTRSEEKECFQVLDELLHLLNEGEKLSETIAKTAADIESKLENGESFNDIDVSTEIDRFNAESTRLKQETEVLIRQNQELLGQTRQHIFKVIDRVKVLNRRIIETLQEGEHASKIPEYKNFLDQLFKRTLPSISTKEENENGKFDKTEL